MAHELSITSGQVEMAYAGERPWHGLGTHVPGLMTTEEALQAANLDWTVSKCPVLSSYDLQPIPETYTTLRDDTKQPLGVVGKRYEPINNRDAFSFFDTVLGEGQGQIDTIGALGQGERVWCLAQLPDIAEILPGEPVERYLLVWNSHDGSKGLEVMFTNIRVVCNNTLTAAVRDCRSKVSIRHTSQWRERANQAQMLLYQSKEYWEHMKAISLHLARNSVTRVEVGTFLETMFPVHKESTERSIATIEKQRNQILELMETGRGTEIPGVRGTAWGLWNAFTEYLDHEKPTRGDKHVWERSVFDENSTQLRTKALEQLIH